MAEQVDSERHAHPKHAELYVFKRAGSRYYYAETHIAGRKERHSLRTDRLTTALKLAEEWFKPLLRATESAEKRRRLDRLASDPTIGELFTTWKRTLSKAKRAYCEAKWGAVGPFWRAVIVSEITPQLFRDYYLRRRRTKTQYGTVVTNNTLKKDVTLLRQVLAYAHEEGHISQLPIIPKVGKIEANPRPWLTRDEWATLCRVAMNRMEAARANPRVFQRRWDLWTFMRVLVESCLRVNELRELTAGQVTIVPKQGEVPEYARLDVKGKRGHRIAIVGGEGATWLEERMEGLKPHEKLWPHKQREAFAALLIAAGLRYDQFRNQRNLKSLRATGISFKILAGVALWKIARQAGTSIAMIDNYYGQRLTAEMSAAELATETI